MYDIRNIFKFVMFFSKSVKVILAKKIKIFRFGVKKMKSYRMIMIKSIVLLTETLILNNSISNKPARNLCKRLAAQHPATMKVAGTSVELVSTV